MKRRERPEVVEGAGGGVGSEAAATGEGMTTAAAAASLVREGRGEVRLTGGAGVDLTEEEVAGRLRGAVAEESLSDSGAARLPLSFFSNCESQVSTRLLLP